MINSDEGGGTRNEEKQNKEWHFDFLGRIFWFIIVTA